MQRLEQDSTLFMPSLVYLDSYIPNTFNKYLISTCYVLKNGGTMGNTGFSLHRTSMLMGKFGMTKYPIYIYLHYPTLHK